MRSKVKGLHLAIDSSVGLTSQGTRQEAAMCLSPLLSLLMMTLLIKIPLLAFPYGLTRFVSPPPPHTHTHKGPTSKDHNCMVSTLETVHNNDWTPSRVSGKTNAV